MADVFLSYRNTEERRRIVTRFATILRAHGITVWWDYGLEAGESYEEQIHAALREAKIVIPFWCEESITSEWVKAEATQGKDKLFPARLQKVTPPPAFERLHAAHLEKWNGSILDPALDEFVRDICRKLGKPVQLAPDTRAELASLPAITPLSETGQSTGKPKRRGFAPALLGLSVLTAGLIGVAWTLGWLVLPNGDKLANAEGTAMSSRQIDTARTEPSVERPSFIVTDDPLPNYELPNDPLLDKQWYLSSAATGGTGILDYVSRTQADGSGVVLAIIDTGVMFSHEEFVRSTNYVGGYDFISKPHLSNDGDGRDPDPTDTGHACGTDGTIDGDTQFGTHIGSILVANTNNETGIAAIAPGLNVVAARAIGRCGGTLTDVNDALLWTAGVIPQDDASGREIWNESPADIVLLPVGLIEACPSSLQDALDTLAERDVLVISAAGPRDTPTALTAPGGCDNVLTVGATDARGVSTSYSGQDVDLFAPGGDLDRDDNGDGAPDGILGAKESSSCIDPATNSPASFCKYAYEKGTAHSATIVAGAAALLKSQHPQYDAEDLKRVLTSSVIEMPTQCVVVCDGSEGETQMEEGGLCQRPCTAGRLDLARAR